MSVSMTVARESADSRTASMSASRIRAAIVAALVLGAILVGTTASQVPSSPVAAAGLGAGGEFHPLGPERVFDSRVTGGKRAASLAGAEFQVPLAGMKGLPANPSDILAVVANVTVVEPEAAGWLAVRPTGSTAGISALVNFPARQNVPNLAFVGVGADGSMTVKLRAANGSRAHVVVDVFGWISTSSWAQRGARLVTTQPARLVDTRNNAAPLRTNQTLPVTVRGASSYSPSIAGIVPNSPDVTAVVVNIAAINNNPGSTSTYVSATPVPVAPGATSATANINVVAGQIKTSMAIVPIGPDGKIYLRNHSGNLHVAVDVFGYLQQRPDDTTTGRIVPLAAPFRALDTREPAFGNVPLGTGSIEDWSFSSFANSVTFPSTTGPQAQSALIGNLTATNIGRVYPTVPVSTYLTAFPAQSARPLVSNLNIAEGEVVPNMSLVKYGTSGSDPYQVRMYNHLGSAHYVLDVYAVVLG